MANRVELIFEALNRTEKGLAEVQRDAKRAASNVEQLMARGGAGMKTMETNARGAAAGVAGIGGGASLAIGKLLLLEMAVNKIAQVLNRLVFSFNSTLETANLGMAASFVSAGQYIDETSGKALQGQQALVAAQGDAKVMTEELQVANFQTIATLDQLIRAYQETLPVAMARGFDRKQVKEFTVAMVQAAGALGVSLDMLGEETRSMLTGAINPRTSRIATVLGLTNEDVAVYKGNAAGLYSFLMDKLSAYQAAGVVSQQTWAGVWSNTLDLFNQLSAKVSEPLFETIKAELQDITGEIVKINTETGKIEWNPGFLENVNDVKNGVAAVIGEFYRLGMLIDKIGGSLTTLGAVITFGEWDTQMREWNKKFENNYAESDQKLQELANRLAGLNSDGSGKGLPAKTTYKPNDPPPDLEELEKQRKAKEKRDKELLASGRTAGNAVADDPWLQQERDKWEVHSREFDLMLAREAEAQAANALLFTDKTDDWLLQEQDKWDVHARGVAVMAENESAAWAEMENAVNGWASAFSGQLNEIFWSADVTFKDILTSFGKMLSQMVIQKQIVEPILGFDWGGLFSGGSADFVGPPAPPKFHSGGIFVPKFHFGGLNSNEGMAILKGGERTLTEEQNRTFDKLTDLLTGGARASGSGSGGTEVNVYNQAEGTKATTERRTGPNGREIIDVIVSTVNDAMGRGSFDNSLGQNFGLNRRGR